jgi:hypothetical protein
MQDHNGRADDGRCQRALQNKFELRVKQPKREVPRNVICRATAPSFLLTPLCQLEKTCSKRVIAWLSCFSVIILVGLQSWGCQHDQTVKEGLSLCLTPLVQCTRCCTCQNLHELPSCFQLRTYLVLRRSSISASTVYISQPDIHLYQNQHISLLVRRTESDMVLLSLRHLSGSSR